MKSYHIKGFINFGGFYTGDADDCLAIKDDYNNLVFAEFFEKNLDDKQVSINYYISDKALSREELEEQYIKKISGLVDATIYPVYSDVTGYLWTSEECKVGGHDLFKELCSYADKYIDMIIEVEDD